LRLQLLSEPSGRPVHSPPATRQASRLRRLTGAGVRAAWLTWHRRGTSDSGHWLTGHRRGTSDSGNWLTGHRRGTSDPGH